MDVLYMHAWIPARASKPHKAKHGAKVIQNFMLKKKKKKIKKLHTKKGWQFLPLVNIYPQFPRCSSRIQLCPTEAQTPSPAATTRPHPEPPPARPEGIRPAVRKWRLHPMLTWYNSTCHCHQPNDKLPKISAFFLLKMFFFCQYL